MEKNFDFYYTTLDICNHWLFKMLSEKPSKSNKSLDCLEYMLETAADVLAFEAESLST